MPNKILKKKVSLKNNKLSLNKNSVEFLKSGQIYTLLATSIILVIYTSSMIYYLNKLKDCECYKLKNKNNYSNLSYLITIEAIILAVNLLTAIMCIFVISMTSGIKSGGAKDDIIPFYISIILMLIISIYFVYYVYKLYENVDPDCPCTQSPLRYLLYIQAILTIINIIILLFNLFA
jgi:hypothetical protein